MAAHIKSLILLFICFSLNWAADVDQQLQEAALQLELGNKLDAHRVFARIISNHPHHPAGYLFTLAASYIDQKITPVKGIKLADRILEKCKPLFRKNPTPRALFYRGCAMGFRSLFLLKQEKWWQAYENGRRAVEDLNMVLLEDPGFSDAYLGLGLFYAQRYLTSQTIWWLSTDESDYDQGKKQLLRSFRSGKWTRPFAREFLNSYYEELDLSGPLS